MLRNRCSRLSNLLCELHHRAAGERQIAMPGHRQRDVSIDRRVHHPGRLQPPFPHGVGDGIWAQQRVHAAVLNDARLQAEGIRFDDDVKRDAALGRKVVEPIPPTAGPAERNQR